MNLLMKLLMFPDARRQASQEVLPKFAKIIEVDLESVASITALNLQSHLALRLAQEGFRRAAEADSEGIARNGAVYSLCESIGQNALKICRGNNVDDPELVRILVAHGVLKRKEPNHTAEPASPSNTGSS